MVGQKTWKLILLLLFHVWNIEATTSPDDIKIDWTHHISLPGGFQLKWFSTNETWLTFEMSAPTKGYLGIGFSVNGGMAGSDIALGWVDENGTAYLKDYYGTKNGAPTEDPSQDFELLDAKENENGTKITFRRKWDTCDYEYDRVLGDDTVRLIWAWHADDPKDHLHWHGPGVQRGVKSVYLKVLGKPKRFPDDKDHPNPEILHWDIGMENFTVPQASTRYHCKIFTLPKLDKKHHMIGYRPLIKPKHIPYVHHIGVFICHVPDNIGNTEEIFEKYLGTEGEDCFGADTPRDWTSYCFTLLLAHGIGAKGDIFPDHLGFPLGETTDKTYLRFEIHYENPDGLHLVDSSGLRVFYTPKIRENDVAMVFGGHRRTPFLSIPPHQSNFKIIGHCPSECTKMGIPKEGIKLISVLLHAHLAGRKMTLRHIRNGKELPVIAQDHAYDFNYQEHRIFPEEVLFLPGDELLMECDYSTEDRENFTLGGLPGSHEMCEAFIYYYPRTNLVDCRSQPDLYSYLDAINVQNVSGDVLNKLNLPYDPYSLPDDVQAFALTDDSMLLTALDSNVTLDSFFNTIEIDEPKNVKGMHLMNYMYGMNWDDKNLVTKIQDQWRNGPLNAHCTGEMGRRIKQEHPTLSIPKFDLLPKEDTQRRQHCEKK